MSRLKNMSRGGYIVVGIVMALILVPSGVAAALAYNGIEGSSGHEANVSDYGQLLTTPALPSAYRDYHAFQVDSAGGASGEYLECVTAATIPTGDAFVAQQVEVDVSAVDSPSSYSGPPAGNASNSDFAVLADSPSDGCGFGSYITSGEAPNTTGNAPIPLVPGYVIPSGYHLDVTTFGMNAAVYVTGYLVPSADAPSSPEVASHGTPQLPAGRP